MEVNLITTKFKEFNRGLNLLIILLSFMVLLFLISQWLPESAIANRISAILILLVCVVIILAFFFLIIRNMNKETKIIDASQVKKMTINSGEDVDGIKGYNEIDVCGNFIELVNSDQLIQCF